MKRRDFIKTAAVLAASTPLSGALAQQDYPNRPITFIVPWAAGSGSDLAIRALARAAAPLLGQNIIVENKAGAGGTLGPVGMAQSARPDGYTISQVTTSAFRLPIIRPSTATWNPEKDFTYIANMAGYVFAIYASEKSGFKTWGDLIAFAKANPGAVTYGTPGAGTSLHVGAELLARAAGVTFTHVPYKSSTEVHMAAISGQIMAGSISGLDAKQFQDEGKLKFLNVWTETRSAKLPDVPTLKELGFPFVFDSPWGIAGPKGMDPKIVAKLEAAFKAALADKDVLKIFDTYDMVPRFMDAAGYTKFVGEFIATDRVDMERLGMIEKKT